MERGALRAGEKQVEVKVEKNKKEGKARMYKSFREMPVWQEAMAIAEMAFELTRKIGDGFSLKPILPLDV